MQAFHAGLGGIEFYHKFKINLYVYWLFSLLSNGDDRDCCGSTTAANTTLAMMTIAAPMATIA